MFGHLKKTLFAFRSRYFPVKTLYTLLHHTITSKFVKTTLLLVFTTVLSSLFDMLFQCFGVQ